MLAEIHSYDKNVEDHFYLPSGLFLKPETLFFCSICLK